MDAEVQTPDVMDDLKDLLDALGLFSGARPQTPHEVMRLCIETVRMLKGEDCLHSCGGNWQQSGPKAGHLLCLACGETLAWMSA